MPISKFQSTISEVRDQLSLDFAIDTYLNHISANLGVNRPVFGFEDDVWRAIVKVLAVEYKQISNKFRDVLDILYGPRITLGATLAVDAAIGDIYLILNDVSNLPQRGTLILDEGQATEEIVSYGLIDYETNQVFLNDELTIAHSAMNFDAESDIIAANTTATSLVLTNTLNFPTSGFPYTTVVGRGTSNEEVVSIISNDQVRGVLGLSSPLINTHQPLIPSTVLTTLSRSYVPASYILELTNLVSWPETGSVLLDAVDSFTATGGTSTTVVCAANTFTAEAQVGYLVVFDGNVTAGLAGVEETVLSNTTTTLAFFESLPATPAAGDTFSIRPLLEYIDINYEESYVTLRDTIEDVTIPATTGAALLERNSTALLAPVKLEGSGWDLYQATKNKVEIYFPESLKDENDLRSASFLHTVEVSPTPATTLSGGVSPGTGPFTITVASTADFPLVGVITLNAGNPTEERTAYYVVDATTLGIPETSIVVNSHLAAETVTLYQPVYVASDLLIGDHNEEADTFPGPYLYDVTQEAPTAAVATTTTTTQLLPGPTTLVMAQRFGRTALEVKDASSFELTNFPYQAHIGYETGNFEVLTINDVNLHHRTQTTMAATALPGVTELQLTTLDPSGGSAGDGATFPNVNGYRVLLGKGTAEEEVVWVTGTTTGPDRLLLENATLLTHTIGTSVELMSDVLSVNSLTDNHTGVVSFNQRSDADNTHPTCEFARYPVLLDTDFSRAEKIEPLISSIEVVDSTGLDITGGRIILNFGSNKVQVDNLIDLPITAGDTVVELISTDGFPTTYPYAIILEPGTPVEEVLLVTNNNTTLDDLTIAGGSYGTKFNHTDLKPVLWVPGGEEVLEYSSVVGNTINFSTPVKLAYTHSPGTLVVDSGKDSIPATTGFDFPLRLPTSPLTILQFVIDLIRAAGIEVSVIEQR